MMHSDKKFWQNRSVGLMGGSFNPAHEGHRAISLYALETLKLDAVWWLVSPQNPLKSTEDMAPLNDRLAEAKRLSNHPQIMPLALETELGTRYTADTLKAVRQHYPGTRFVWLMGTDNLLQIPQWRDWESIYSLVPIAIFDRPGYTEKALAGEAAARYKFARLEMNQAETLVQRLPPAWIMLNNPPHTASATAIREARKKLKEEDAI